MTDKRIPARFYRTESGTEPVRDWLKSLSSSERRLIGTDIKTVEYSWPVGMPTCRPMGNGLYEVRTNLPQGKIARVLFCIHAHPDGFTARIHQEDSEDPQARLRFSDFKEAKAGGPQMSSNPYIGSSLDEFLEEDNTFDEVNAIALKRVLAWQIEQAMEAKGLTKTEMAERMNTSRAALNRLLDPDNTSVTLNTMERAARAVGKRLQLDLITENDD